MDALSVARSAVAALVLAGTAGHPPAGFARAAAAAPAAPTLEQIEAALDAGRPDQALRLLAEHERDDRTLSARALLLRSTAHFMLGATERGRHDLERALASDPRLRQGWLNRAALDISEGNLDAALEAFRRARELDPDAPDTDLNIGAVLLLQGKADEAAPHLERYLAASGDSAEAWYLVASNYALGGQAGPAVEHLARAIAIDERMRLRARTDANFTQLAEGASFQQLLATESYRIPADSHAIYRTYDQRYLGGEGKLLAAVLDALQLSGEPFDHQIEVTPDWALIWGEMRIKVRDDSRDGGRVELTAPRGRFGDAEWRARANKLLAEIAVQLAKR